MTAARFITAIGTPLTDDDQLHVEGLGQHLDDQADAGIDSLLIGGTMGLMPLQTDTTWRNLVEQSVKLSNGRFELLVGATDVSTSRALERIAFTNTVDGIDAVVVMVPGLFKFSQPEYIQYFTDLADASRYPIYLYDLEPLTGVHLSVETIAKLGKHKNIAGLKISSNVPEAVRLDKYLDGAPFRLIIAEPVISDMLFRHGYAEHLDGIYAIAPHWAVALTEAAKRDDWDEAAVWQRKLTGIKELALTLPVWQMFTGIMNLRGLAGKYAPRPTLTPTPQSLAHLRELPLVQELLATTSAKV